MTGDSARDQELFPRRKIRHPFRRWRGVSPGPCGKLVDEIVSREHKLVRCDLTRGSEGGGMGYGRPPVAEGGDGGVEDLHDGGVRFQWNK